MRLLSHNAKRLLCLAALGLVFPASLTGAAEDNSAGTIALETSADRLLFDRSSGRLVSLRGKNAARGGAAGHFGRRPGVRHPLSGQRSGRSSARLPQRQREVRYVQRAGRGQDTHASLHGRGWPGRGRRAGRPRIDARPLQPLVRLGAKRGRPGNRRRAVPLRRGSAAATARWSCRASADRSARSRPFSNCPMTASAPGV